MLLFNKVEEAIEATNKGAVAAYADSSSSEVEPRYIVFEGGDTQLHARFLCLVNDLEFRRNIPACIRQLEDILDGIAVELVHLKSLFLEDRWLISPKLLIADETSRLSQEEDNEWYDSQRQHFAQVNS